MTAVKWLYENTLSNPMSNQDILYNEEVLKKAEDMLEYQIKRAYEDGARLALISQSPLALHKGEFPNPDEYYNEQFINQLKIN
jgi:hypothetical protein